MKMCPKEMKERRVVYGWVLHEGGLLFQRGRKTLDSATFKSEDSTKF